MLRTQVLAAMGAALIVGGLPAAVLAADPPVTLRLVIVDADDDTQAPYATRFVEEVATRSGGAITIEPVWEGDHVDLYEQGVAKHLVDGGADLALVPSRGWDAAGIDSLKVLEAPMLIDDLAVAAAVATSPVADELLAAMEPGGAVGLALWPEDLTHPVQGGCLGPVTDPAQLAGQVIRSVPSATALDVIATLGATHTFPSPYGAQVAACEINALFMGLRRTLRHANGGEVFTGDVTLAPRMDVLAANATTFGRLTDAQRAVLREAAVATRDVAIADEPSEAETAATWCGMGGTVLLAGPDGVAAFRKALQPVTDRLAAADDLAAKAIAEISALRSTVTPSAPIEPCGPAATPSDVPLPSPDVALYQGTLPPDGTYRLDISEQELADLHASQHFAAVQANVYTITFQGDTVLWQEGQRDPCPNDITSDGAVFKIREQVPDTCLGGDWKWRAVPGGIELLPILPASMSAQDKTDIFALFFHTWTRVD